MSALMRRGALAAAMLVGCGDAEPPPGADGGPGVGRLLPLAVGASWTYRITDPSTGKVEQKASTVEALEDVGDRKAGIIAFRVRTEKTDGATVSWQEDRGTSIVRHREQSFNTTGIRKSEEWYEAFKMRIDETEAHLVKGASWTETMTETHVPAAGLEKSTMKSDLWTVEAVDDSVTVPAGTFTTLRVRRGDKVYWFARGVGKIKETGGQTEELSALSR